MKRCKKTGLVIAIIAAIVLILFLKIKPTLSEEELETLNGEKEDHRVRIKREGAAQLLVQSIEDGTLDEIQRVVRNGIDIRQKIGSQTLLMIAARSNPNVEVIDYLLNQGIEINDVDDQGQTALIIAAAFSQNAAIITKLLQSGADKTIKDKAGRTAADCIALNVYVPRTEMLNLLKVD